MREKASEENGEREERERRKEEGICKEERQNPLARPPLCLDQSESDLT